MSLKQRIVARLNRTTWFGGKVHHHGPAAGLMRQGDMGLLPSLTPGMHEGKREVAFLESLPWKGLTVYDVGGDQGLFAIFFAHRVGAAGRVVVFEPNGRSCESIQRNVKVNGFQNVLIVPVGLGERRETVEFTVPSWDPSLGTAIESIAHRIKADGDAEFFRVEINSLDDMVRSGGLPAPDFIKIDIEGMEYPALRGMQETIRAHQPRLFIEVHGYVSLEERMNNTRGVVALLEGQGYRLRRIESDELISSETVGTAEGGHYYCEPRTEMRQGSSDVKRA